jgi:signal transduction histidine kinase
MSLYSYDKNPVVLPRGRAMLVTKPAPTGSTIYLISFPVPVRYSIGWYAGRVFGLVSSSLVLFVLLYEITMLYAQLLRAVLAQRREREVRLMTGDAVAATIAHEVKQPLSAMATNADAGLRWLDRTVPDLDEAKAAFKKIAGEGHRAGAVIGSIGRCSRATPGTKLRSTSTISSTKSLFCYAVIYRSTV